MSRARRGLTLTPIAPLVDIQQKAVRYAPIEIDHTPGRGWFRAGGRVTVRVREPVEEQETVTCAIPGHDRSGRDVVAELLRVEDGPLKFELGGKCGYEATFDYSSDGA